MKAKTFKWRHALWLALAIFVLLILKQEAKASVPYTWIQSISTRSAVFSKDDQSILIGTNQGLYILNAEDGTIRKQLVDSGFYSAFYSEEGKTIFAFGKRVAILDTNDLSIIKEFENDSLIFISGSTSPDGTKLMLNERDYPTFRIWDISSGKISNTLFLGLEYQNDPSVREIKKLGAVYSSDGLKIFVFCGASVERIYKPTSLIKRYGIRETYNSETYEKIFFDSTSYNIQTGEGIATYLVDNETDQSIEDYYTTNPEKHTLNVIDLNTHKTLKTYNFPLRVKCIKYTPDRNHWIMAYEGLTIYNLITRQIIDTIAERGPGSLGTMNFTISHKNDALLRINDQLILWKYDFNKFNDILEEDFQEVLYPNPTTNLLTIKFNLPKSEIVSVNLLSLDGKLIRNIFDGFLDLGEHKIQTATSGISSGNYFIVIHSDTFSKTLKLIIEK